MLAHPCIQGHSASIDEVDRSVKQVAFAPFLDAFISCVPVSRASLIVRPLKKLTGGQEFSINRVRHPCLTMRAWLYMELKTGRSLKRHPVSQGVSTFDFSEQHNLIATGGADCILRLWNPYVPTRPMAALEGHISAISHLAFNRLPGQVITLSTDDVIRIWDVQEHVRLWAWELDGFHIHTGLNAGLPQHPLGPAASQVAEKVSNQLLDVVRADAVSADGKQGRALCHSALAT